MEILATLKDKKVFAQAAPHVRNADTRKSGTRSDETGPMLSPSMLEIA
tara:strand:+ start:201 stop:344 length:144 start_codon:yes stop_codon:yes gene_type:complete